jgi:hypothetical protein
VEWRSLESGRRVWVIDVASEVADDFTVLRIAIGSKSFVALRAVLRSERRGIEASGVQSWFSQESISESIVTVCTTLLLSSTIS